MSMQRKTDDELKAREARCEWWAKFGAVIVVLALLAEVWLALEYPHGTSFFEIWGTVVATAAIAFGIMMEIGFGQGASKARHDLQIRSEAELAEAKRNSAAATKQLAEYRISRAQRVIDNFSLLVERMKPFAGTKFDIGLGPEGMREQWDFSWQIEPAFGEAGWQMIDWWGGSVLRKWCNLDPKLLKVRPFGLANVVNVSIEMHPSHKVALTPAAEALAQALREIGVTVSTEYNNNASANENVLHFLIGEKQ